MTLVLAFAAVLQTAAQIQVNGVFGGGQNGQINTSGNTADADASTITVNAGTIANVWGGGEKGNTTGGTKVNLRGGNVGSVFGGARMADISGGTTVTIDGSGVTQNLTVKNLYGGNDISGQISGTAKVTSTAQDANNSNIIYIGNLFGGGNGDYDYTSTYQGKQAPAIVNTSVNLLTGAYGNVYAGGNNAPVTGSATITLNNSSTVLKDSTGTALTHQFGNVFGGNNKVAMAIRPTWNLTKASVKNLYGGGNRGAMTYPNGIALIINSADMTVENVFGGCRLADVTPAYASKETIGGYEFDAGFGSRVLIDNGKITNVYGGNDIAGNVAYGTNVVLRHSILGDVYGGGNGSYAYTNRADKSSSDYYFNASGTAMDVLDALYQYRPNSENVLIRILGQDKNDKTYIGGSVYCGGNSATLLSGSGNPDEARAKLEIGSDVIVNQVFMGSNGANMIQESVLKNIQDNNLLTGVDLRESAQFDRYMDGVSVSISPTVSILDIADADKDLKDPTYIGSFYCGGNVGSMTAAGTFSIDFLNSVVIFDKLVAGCNSANVAKTSYNAFHKGGLTTHADTKVNLNLAGLLMEPKILTVGSDGSFNFTWGKFTTAGLENYLKGGNIYGGCYTSGYVDGNVRINISKQLVTQATIDWFDNNVVDGVRYGWDEHCYEPLASTLCVFGGGYGDDTEIWGNSEINITGTARVVKVRGGGEKGWIGKMQRDADGKLIAADNFETINGTSALSIQKYQVVTPYNATVNLNADTIHNAQGLLLNNVGEICAGGQEGVVTGNTYLNLDGGSCFCAFGGASNSHVYGATQVIIGKNGFPYVTETVYGGNDFGGQIMGTLDHATGNTASGSIKTVRSNTYVEYLHGEIGFETGKADADKQTNDDARADYGIFAGAFGKYDYSDDLYQGKYYSKPNLLSRIQVSDAEKTAGMFAANSFLNISTTTSDPKDKVHFAYAGSEGNPGQRYDADVYQSYALLNGSNSEGRGGNDNFIAQQVFGGGDCSESHNSRLDAYKTYASVIYGGSRGMSNDRRGAANDFTYMPEHSELNVYSTLAAPEMDVYGAGAYSGSQVADVNLYGGSVHNVYGAQINEGITYLARVNVPESSTVTANALYGGGKGAAERDACDTYIAAVNYKGTNAHIKDALYGGNHDYRLTRNAYMNVSVPVLDPEGELVDVYGAGYGAKTIVTNANVNLTAGGRAMNVFGGGREGMVYDWQGAVDYLAATDYNSQVLTRGYAAAYEASLFNAWKNSCTDTVGGVQVKNLGIADLSLSAGSSTDYCAVVSLPADVTVDQNVYGGGYGQGATVKGNVHVNLIGADVLGDLYGGGYGGDVEGSTTVDIIGGTVRNAYAGGFEGSVGTLTSAGSTTMNVGVEGYDIENGVIKSRVGLNAITALNGDPAVGRSLFGGGEKGPVYGTSTLNFYNGHVGYTYNSQTGQYVENTDYSEPGDDVLRLNGNVFGGGYGEGATVRATSVNMYGGTIRNGLYGGGEIASVGTGTVVDVEGSTDRRMDKTKEYEAGSTQVRMYKGHVIGDVFGGGRGFSYDMSGNEVIGYKFYTDGYVFGPTSVDIYGGEIGTESNVEDGNGNVFGGGNVGFVYSIKGSRKAGVDTEGRATNYYYDSNDKLTEDCRVMVSPYAQVGRGKSVTIDGTTFSEYQFVPTEYLNKLPKIDSRWDCIDDTTGVTVHNAVFAGGNVTQGSDKLYANAVTVYGNATATLYDIYHHDLISVGGENVGGLYGDGNLTLVDGYRELSVSNYGTDYYGLQQEITVADYLLLNDRERAYFELKYKCISPYDKYVLNHTISEAEYRMIPDSVKSKWQQNGFCSIYAGRLLNTIQRADFLGVFGSRIVLEGAQDRVVDVVDYTEYAMNRIGELSINCVTSQAGDDPSSDDYVHGNYFGLYNIVNYLEAMTSDVDFYHTVRTADTQNEEIQADGTTTYYAFKAKHLGQKYANNATTMNKVALAKGVYLELARLNSAGMKEYGPVTGVFELDLMDTNEELGGAYVYAKNNHYKRDSESSMNEKTILAAKNQGARTYNGITYSTTQKDSLQTSGNFVNKLKQIYDECYPENGDDNAEAHYWFVRGSIYQYDQYVSAYTGSSTAYIADVQIPLTISSGSHGKLMIQSVNPNLYAYYIEPGVKMGKNESKRVSQTTYKLNDIISYWDWSQLGSDEQQYFVKETYVAMQNFKMERTGGTSVEFSSGDVMLPGDLDLTAGAKFYTKDKDGNWQLTTRSAVVRPSNNMSHATGYALTADITNPREWDDLYMRKDSNYAIYEKKAYEEYITAHPDKKDQFIDAPSYKLKDGESDGVYGQRSYDVNAILNSQIVQGYMSGIEEKVGGRTDQAKFEKAYVSIEAVHYTYNKESRNLQEGVVIPETEYNALAQSIQNSFEEAYVCTSTIDDGVQYHLSGEVIGTTAKAELDSVNQTLLLEAYVCSKAGKYGGTFFESNKYYSALETLCSLDSIDRKHFEFNWDAFDLFITDFKSNDIADYSQNNGYRYYGYKDIEYEAIYNGENTTLNGVSLVKGNTYDSETYDLIPNEKCHYTEFTVSDETMYIVTSEFVLGETMYVVGKTISEAFYLSLDESQKACVGKFTFASYGNTVNAYFCKEAYQVGEHTMGASVTDMVKGTVYNDGANVPLGTVISSTDYGRLPNEQAKFSIIGRSPIETSTLYVSREADIRDVSKDRIVTLVYQYQYQESSEDGSQVEQISERHVVNIHVAFKTGVPKIGELKYPGVIFPGATMGLRQPTVSEGAYEIIGGGWEIYEDEEDAKAHINGVEYVNNKTKMYYYQDGYYTAYYTKTYLGKTYSNAVPLVVANYHHMDDVMNSVHDEEYDTGARDSLDNPIMATRTVHDYMYLNEAIRENVPDDQKLRNPKIYLDSRSCSGDSTELDELARFIEISYDSTGLSKVKGGKNIDFILQSNVTTSVDNWTSMGTASEPFCGNLHGNGHAVNGINSSLFGQMDGNVWNLGVYGAITGSGIMDQGTGTATNCWVWSSANAVSNVYPVAGNDKMVNCHYLDVTGYKTSTKATKRTKQEFMNGSVAYDLNGYYLNKRYQDTRSLTTGTKYGYWSDNGSGKLVFHSLAYYPVGTDTYVETMFGNEDFIYQGGTNPSSVEKRLYVGESYYPIYPDDYIFFGQNLTYDIIPGSGAYTPRPEGIKKAKTTYRLLTDAQSSNRVYRAPAFYGSSTLSKAYFNKMAAFDGVAGGEKVYDRLTALDFSGYGLAGNNNDYTDKASGYGPVLDFDGLAGLSLDSVTANILVYANPSSVSTYTALENALDEPVMTEGSTYHEVAVADHTPKGHLVDRQGNSFVATHNHMLVDAQDFNAPYQYKYADGYYMWYQRTPALYASIDNDGKPQGWETLCLPFTADFVSAQNKGLLTHFFNKDKDSHEYWLRGYRGFTDTADGITAQFLTPVVNSSSAAGFDSRYQKASSYTVDNTFLDDYYYSNMDRNGDSFQSYYGESRTYQDYPYVTAGVPYIIAFPGSDYFEFDMSGKYELTVGSNVVTKLGAQTITFVSIDNQTIGVTDNQTLETGISNSGRTVALNGTFVTASPVAGNYVMNAAGSAFEKLAATGQVAPFRASMSYAGGASQAPARMAIGWGDDELVAPIDMTGKLDVRGGVKQITVTSYLDDVCTLTVTAAQGQRVSVISVRPGQTVNVGVGAAGLYIVGNIKVMVR